MATSSNTSSQSAAAAVETGNESLGGITGGGAANVSFEGQAPAQEQAPIETPAQSTPSAVDSFVTQGLSESTLAQPQQQQRQVEQERRPVQSQPVQTQQQERVRFNPQSTVIRTDSSGNIAARPVSTQQPVMQQAAQQPTLQSSNLIGPMAQQPSGVIGGAAPESTVGPVRSSVNNLAENQPIGRQQQQAKPTQSQYPEAPTQPAQLREAGRQVYDQRDLHSELIGREEIRREGVVEKPEPVNTISYANRRFKRAQKFLKDKINKVIKRENSYSGTSFYETIFSDEDIMPHCVSIGSENLFDSLREPNSNFLQLVNDKRAEIGLDPLDLDACLSDISLLVNTINNDLNIEVTLEKTPVNTRDSIQVRTLRAHNGRGLGLHPTQTKGYNADYDGDPAILNTDQRNIRSYSRAMTHLIDSEGNATIDPDFFPLDPIDVEYKKDIVEHLKETYFSWNPDLVSKVIDGYIDACNKGDWVSLLRKIDEVAGTVEGEYRGEVASAILKSLYDFSTDRRGLSIETQFESLVEHSNYNPPDPNLDPFIYNLIDIVDEIVAGRPAPNFQEFTRFYNKYYGDVKGKKNVPFRLLADFAKAINRTDLITVGSDIFGIKPIGTDTSGITQDARLDMSQEVSISQLWQFTCAAGISKQISGRMRMGSRQLAVSTQVRNMVMRECPLPKYEFNNPNNPVDQQFRNWITAFIDSYNRNMRMLEIAQVSFRQGMTPVRSQSTYKGIDKKTFDGIAKALVEVFGDITVSRMFPDSILHYGYMGQENTNTGVVNQYRNMSLATFAVNNRITFKKDTNTGAARMKFIANNIARNEFTPMDILMLVADRRTKKLGDYNKAWLEATKENFGTLQTIQENIANNEFNEYTMNMLEFMHLMSPDIFDYYGMDSPITFAKSKWGKKLINADNVSEFRSHLVSMMVEYRLSKSSKILTELNNIDEKTVAGFDSIDHLIEATEALDAAFELEMDSLASSSMAWETIAKESMEGNRVFLSLIQKGGIEKEGWKERAGDFWKSEQAQKYHTLITFLKSSEPYETKVAVLADVTRVRTNYADILPEEIMGQLAHHPDRLHAGNRFDMDSDIQSEIDTAKESVNRINSYREKTLENIEKESARILEEANKDKAAFEARLRRFSDDPGYMVHVDSILAADAIASIYDKTYDDSEKIKQQATVNGYFGALSLQRSGGYYTHLQQTDNAVVNMVGFDQLTVADIVRILGNPDIEFTTYDEFGTPAPVSRETLCGGDTIDDVIRYLESNPRISLACRRFIAGIGSDVNGTARMNAINSMMVGDGAVDRVFSLLNDRPRFLAIAALCTSANQNVGRNLVDDVHDNLNNLCNFIAMEATVGKGVTEIMKDAEGVLGIYPEIISDLRSRGSFDDTPSDLDYDAAGNMYSEVMSEILDCIELVQNSGIEIPANFPQLKNMTIDESSIVSYYDARQQLSGARTSMMIGIEGAETKKNLVLKEYLRNRPDTYMMSEDGTTVIPVVEGLEPTDLTLEHDPNRQLNSIAKFLEVKREKGAETFNAKAKKYGDDGTNSIIKFIKMGTRSMFDHYGMSENDTWSIEDGQDLLDRIAKCETKFEAVPILAQALIEADARLGYTDGVQFVESDYWNRADLMIAESVDEEGNTTFVVRSLEQLAVAMRNRLSDEAVASQDREVVLAELQQIVDTLGTAADPMTMGQDGIRHHCLYNVSLHSSIGNRYRVDRALRQRSSSTERSYTLINKLFHEFDRANGQRYTPPSRERIEERSKQMLNKLPYWLSGRLKSLANPEYYKGSYDYLGASNDPETQIFPGPQNLILFQGSLSDPANQRMIKRCNTYGVTMAFENINDVPQEYIEDVLFTGEFYILPFFDMKLNGSMSSPIMPAPAQFPFSPDNVLRNVEDTTYEFREGDATFHTTQECVDRVHIIFEGDDQVFDRERLFPNVLDVFDRADMQMDFCTNEEIQRYVLNAEFNADEMTLETPGILDDKVSVDIGVMYGDDNYAREAERFRIRLQEYKNSFESADADGFLTDEVRYDSIVGFVKIVIDGNAVAFAPVWPFHLEQSGSVPTTFKVNKVEFNNDSHSFEMQWRYEGSLDGQYIKAFEGIGASNKMIASSKRARSRTLENGLAIDGFYSTKSVASRLFASNKRIHTMISLMMMTRIDKRYAYNFAELSGAFPGDPQLPDGRLVKDALLAGDMGITDWMAVQDIQFHVDPQIDSLVRFWVNKCIDFGTVNPTILLATKTNEGLMWPMATEFECFMDTSLNFQNAFLKLFHTMQPTICPPSIDGNSSETLFKPVTTDTSEDYGVLQVLVPHWRDDGTEYKVPENLYLSFGFFGEEFSGFKKVNFNAFQRSIDSLNVSNNMSGFDLSQMMAFGRAGMSSITMGANMIQAAPDNVTQKAETKDVDVEPDDKHKRILDRKTWGKTLALTGHRPNKLWGYDLSKEQYKIVADQLAEYCRRHNIDTIISGMALGFDQLGAQVAIDNGLKLVAAVPMRGQESRWPKKSQDRYNEILGHADKVVTVSPGSYSVQKMQVRNEWMVDNADAVFALWDGTSGGTGNAVRYAQDKNKTLFTLNPKDIKAGE